MSQPRAPTCSGIASRSPPALLSQVRETIGARAVPPLDAADLDRIADMAFAVFEGGLALIVAAPEGPVRDAAVGELKKVMLRYLAPVFGEAPADAAVTTPPNPG
ncbi:hypothetical protein [Streptomyces roseolus]|uniref:hypothetical protein n=1 Tax=Streptomyces roseolus TaxID=67358 RepID=UPI0036E24AFE